MHRNSTPGMLSPPWLCLDTICMHPYECVCFFKARNIISVKLTLPKNEKKFNYKDGSFYLGIFNRVCLSCVKSKQVCSLGFLLSKQTQDPSNPFILFPPHHAFISEVSYFPHLFPLRNTKDTRAGLHLHISHTRATHKTRKHISRAGLWQGDFPTCYKSKNPPVCKNKNTNDGICILTELEKKSLLFWKVRKTF